MNVNAPALFEAVDISAAYNGRTILHDIRLTIRKGEMVALLGPNGAGKSSLMRLCVGLLPPLSGRLAFEGVEISKIDPRKRAEKMAFLPQESHTLFPVKVWEVVWQGRFPAGGHWIPRTEEDLSGLAQIMEQADVAGLAQREFNKLSGGEKKRVLLARLMAQEASIWILDEPIANLDLYHQTRMVKILKEAQSRGTTVILAEHRIDLMANLSDRLILISDGAILADGTPEEVMRPDLLERAFHIPIRISRDDEGGWNVYPLA